MFSILMNLLFSCYDLDDDEDDDGYEYNDECDDKYIIYEHIDLHGIDLLG